MSHSLIHDFHNIKKNFTSLDSFTFSIKTKTINLSNLLIYILNANQVNLFKLAKVFKHYWLF